MSNRFFDWVASASRFIAYTWARAAEVNSSLDNVSTGFTLVQAEIDENKTRSLRLPVGQDGDITTSAANRARRVLTFDASGLPYIWPPDDAATRANKVFAWDSSGNPILASNGAPYAWLPSQTGNSGKLLTTNGSDPSWRATALTNQSGASGKYLGSNGTVESWSYPFATGFTADFLTGVTPTNWVQADGSDLLSATYPELASILVPTVTTEAFLPFHANWCGYNFVAVSGSYIYTADGYNVYRYSDDHGATWKSLDGTSLWMYSAPGDGYYYRHTTGNIYRSTSIDGTYSLNGSDGDLTLTRNSFKKIGSNYVSIVNLSPSVPLVSTNGMVSFAACTPSAGTFSSPQNLAVSGSTLYAVAATVGTTRLDKSTDGGVTWTLASVVSGAVACTTGSLFINGSSYFVWGGGNITIVATSDAGPWTQGTLPVSAAGPFNFAVFAGYFWLSVGTSLYRSATGAAGTWSSVVPAGSTLNTCQLVVTNATTPRMYLVGVSRSEPAASVRYVQWTEDGTNWTTEWYPNPTDFSAYGGSVKIGSYYVHAWANGIAPVYSTTPDGFCNLSATTTVEVHPTNPTIASDGTNAYILGRAGGSAYLYKSSNGTTWSVVGAAIGTLPTSKLVWGGGKLFAATTTTAYLSDGTTAFTTNSLPGTLSSTPEVNYVAGRYVVYGSTSGTTMYVSSDGVTWLTRSIALAGWPVVGDPSGTTMWCGGYYSTDYGVSWVADSASIYPINSEFPNSYRDDGTFQVVYSQGNLKIKRKSSGSSQTFAYTNYGGIKPTRMLADGQVLYFYQTEASTPTYREASIKATISTTTLRVPTVAPVAGSFNTWIFSK